MAKMIKNLESLTVEDIRKIRDDMYERHYNSDVMSMLLSMEDEIHRESTKGLEIIERIRAERKSHMNT
jgi:hypothetical protein